MPAKNPATGTAADLTLASMAGMFASEEDARHFMESQRWPNGPICPRCNCTEVYTITGKPGSKSPTPPGVYKCKSCREKFTVRIGTLLEESKLPIRIWLMAIHLITSSKKGMGVTRLPPSLCPGRPTQPSQTVHQLRTELSAPARFGTLGIRPSDRSYVPPLDAAGRSPRLASTACPPVPSGP